jgi:hypothetical protein
MCVLFVYSAASCSFNARDSIRHWPIGVPPGRFSGRPCVGRLILSPGAFVGQPDGSHRITRLAWPSPQPAWQLSSRLRCTVPWAVGRRLRGRARHGFVRTTLSDAQQSCEYLVNRQSFYSRDNPSAHIHPIHSSTLIPCEDFRRHRFTWRLAEQPL